MPLREWFADKIGGSPERCLGRAAARLEKVFTASPNRAPPDYRHALRLALQVDPQQALSLFRSYDSRIPDDDYRGAFLDGDRDWLTTGESNCRPAG